MPEKNPHYLALEVSLYQLHERLCRRAERCCLKSQNARSPEQANTGKELDLRRAGELNVVNALQNQINITQGLTIADFDRIIERVEQERQSQQITDPGTQTGDAPIHRMREIGNA
jgi:hypothetical protein